MPSASSSASGGSWSTEPAPGWWHSQHTREAARTLARAVRQRRPVRPRLRATPALPLDTSEQVSDAAHMARAYVELPYGWGPQRLIITAWRRAGYDVDRLVCEPISPDLLIFNGVRP